MHRSKLRYVNRLSVCMSGLYHFVVRNASFSGNNNFPCGGYGITMLVVILITDPPTQNYDKGRWGPLLITDPPTQNYDKGRWGPLTLCVAPPIRSPILFITIPPSPYYFVPSILSRFTPKTPPVTFYLGSHCPYIFFLLHCAHLPFTRCP